MLLNKTVNQEDTEVHFATVPVLFCLSANNK